jgi:ribose transport system substrate-binding protein
MRGDTFHCVKTESRGKEGRDYLVDAVVRASDLLGAFREQGEVLRLKDLAFRTGLSPTTAFRILFTLEHCGLVERLANGRYRSNVKPLRRKAYRLGYAHQGSDSNFVQEWSESIVRAAAEEGLELVVLDHGHDPRTALRNAERLIAERVDLVIDYTVDGHTAAMTAAKFLEAEIPVIALGAPRRGAIYFGPNNYLAGVVGGRHLGHWARHNWREKTDELILLEVSASGPVIQMRTAGFEAGVREMLPDRAPARTVRLKVDGRFADALEAVRAHIRRGRARRILVGAPFDPSGLGALRAIEEAGRSEDCRVVTLGGCIEGRMELRRRGTSLLADVAFSLDRYGEHIVRIAMGVLQKKLASRAVFVRHQALTPGNVDHYYPNDAVLYPQLFPSGGNPVMPA